MASLTLADIARRSVPNTKPRKPRRWQPRPRKIKPVETKKRDWYGR